MFAQWAANIDFLSFRNPYSHWLLRLELSVHAGYASDQQLSNKQSCITSAARQDTSGALSTVLMNIHTHEDTIHQQTMHTV